MECSNCKNTIPNNSNYCPYCMKKVEKKLSLSKKSKVFIILGFVLPYLLAFGAIFYLIYVNFNSNMGSINLKYISLEDYEEKIKENGCTLVSNDKYNEYYETDSKCAFFSSYAIINDTSIREQEFERISRKMETLQPNLDFTSSIDMPNYKRYTVDGIKYEDIVMIDNQIIFIEGKVVNKEAAKVFSNSLGLTIDIIFFNGITILLFLSILLLFLIFIMASWWNLNKKLGRKGYICLIPIYNVLCLAEDVFNKKWLGILFLIPGIQTIMLILLNVKLVQKYRKSSLLIVLSLFFTIVVFALLAFDQEEMECDKKE